MRFYSSEVWKTLSRAVRLHSGRCRVAVAYFGTGAAKLLPLAKGSDLVVDASERAISSGQTNPYDLSVLMRRGAVVYSVPNLHAKVYVIGRSVFIGSANVSHNSAGNLIEALVQTSNPEVVSAARSFVRSLCVHELTPVIIGRLKKIYRPPRIGGRSQKKKSRARRATAPEIPRVVLAKLKLEEWSDEDNRIHDRGLKVAKKRIKKPRIYRIDSFRYRGNCFFQPKDIVIQVTDQGAGNVWVTPPANLCHVRFKNRARTNYFVYVQRPSRRKRIRLEVLARRLDKSTRVRLQRGGVTSAKTARILLRALRG